MPDSASSAAPRKRVAFAVHAPNAEQVALVGDFSGWDPNARPLKQDDTGTWNHPHPARR